MAAHAHARARTQAQSQSGAARSRLDASPFVPPRGGLRTLAVAVQDCRGCPLYAHATQAVFGEGPAHAALMLVGEQPGDQEDRQGHPFVGPAGRLLERALGDAGIARDTVYLTNAVKHFKFEERGKRRLHKKPTNGETRACEPWLMAEIERVKPTVIVCLGATALFSVMGPEVKITQVGGQWLEPPEGDARVIATPHPSAILRMQTSEEREQGYQILVSVLRKAHRAA